VVRTDELAQRTAGVVADERHVLELEPLEQLGDHRGDTERREVRVGAHRDPVRAEWQLRDDAAGLAGEQRRERAPHAAVDEQPMDQHDGRSGALFGVCRRPPGKIELRHRLPLT
jgi:hypothetical protein